MTELPSTRARRLPTRAFAFSLALGLAACGGPAKNAPGGATSGAATQAEPAGPGEAGEAGGAPPAARVSDPATARVQVFALSDFHGWLLPLEPRGFSKYYGGIANLAGQLVHKEKASSDTSIILDNGDIWTGPTESTFLRGEPVIQAYNALGVTAVNIANHEFDFGLEILRARASEAKFPFLGANIVKAGTSEAPDFIRPYLVVEKDGVKIGIVGLSYVDTPKTTLAKHVAGFEFQDYAATLKRVVPRMRAEGAVAIVVLFHDVVDVAEKVIRALPELGINAVVAGQNHRKGQVLVEGTPVVNPGPFGRSYVRFDLEIDRATSKVTAKHEIVDITGEVGAPAYPPSPELTAIAEGARQKAKALSTELLGRLGKPLQVGTFADSPLGHFIVDTWLGALPDVDVAICNHGAIRQPLASGPVTLGDLMSVLPFENNLYVVRLTGKQLEQQLAIDHPVVAGITWSYREGKGGSRQVVSIVDRLGKPLEPNKKYNVAINDFMYNGGDGYTFKESDSTPEDTGISWRQPVIRALRLAESGDRRTEPQSTARARQVR